MVTRSVDDARFQGHDDRQSHSEANLQWSKRTESAGDDSLTAAWCTASLNFNRALGPRYDVSF